MGGINILSGVARWTTTLNPTRGELWGAGRITNFKLQLKVNGVYIQPTNVQLTNKPLSLTEVDPNWVPYTNKITRTNPVNSVRYDNQGAYISNVVYDKTSDTDMEVSARCVACACALRALLLPAAAAGRRASPLISSPSAHPVTASLSETRSCGLRSMLSMV